MNASSEHYGPNQPLLNLFFIHAGLMFAKKRRTDIEFADGSGVLKSEGCHPVIMHLCRYKTRDSFRWSRHST
jgi:hypothetical protein